MNWEQLKAILWLRWRLSRNQFLRAGSLNAVISVLWIAILTLGAVGCAVGGVVGGWIAGVRAPAAVLLLVWDGALFFFFIIWGTGLMVEIQRSESVDLPKLLHLPVTLQQVFVFNYLVSHFTPSMVVAVPAMMGLCVGLICGGGGMFALMLPLLLGFIFVVTAWTYCLRGWLAALMMNKRRRRSIIVWVTVIFVLACQLPNLVFNTGAFFKKGRPPVAQPATIPQPPGPPPEGGPDAQAPAAQPAPKLPPPPGARQIGTVPLPDGFVEAHLMFPPGWLGYGAMTLKEHNPWPALGTAALSWLIGALGLKKAYRLTLRFYQGEDSGARTASKPGTTPQRAARARGQLLVERRLPGLPDDVAALTLATFRSLSRAPELKMAFIMPVIMAIAMGSLFLTHPKGPSVAHLAGLMAPEWAGFIASGAAVFAVFSLAPAMGNVFGLDRSGFCALVLLPTRRHWILFAKNLAFLPFVGVVVLLLLTFATVLARLSWDAFLMGLLQALTAFLVFSLLCNVNSILAPYRIAAGTLQAKKPKPIFILAVFLNFLVLPLVAVPFSIPPGLQLLFSVEHWVPWLPVNLLAAAFLLAGVAWLYRLLLPLEGRLLQRREQHILREVTEETE